MPGKKRFSKKKSRKSGSLKSKMRNIAKEEALRLAETKTVGRYGENFQLFHNVPVIVGGYLQQITQGVTNPTNLKLTNARIGNELYLKNIKQKIWLSNKLDRPNVMYRIIMFKWNANQGAASPFPTVNDIFNWNQTGNLPNCMILNTNKERITVLKDKYIFSDANYAQPYQTQPFPVIAGPGILGRERSQLVTMNKDFKNQKIIYEDTLDGTQRVKSKDIYFCYCAYDAWGSIVTDNIASYAVNHEINFKDL